MLAPAIGGAIGMVRAGASHLPQIDQVDPLPLLRLREADEVLLLPEDGEEMLPLQDGLRPLQANQLRLGLIEKRSASFRPPPS
jgi:hypothetical protein